MVTLNNSVVLGGGAILRGHLRGGKGGWVLGVQLGHLRQNLLNHSQDLYSSLPEQKEQTSANKKSHMATVKK